MIMVVAEGFFCYCIFISFFSVTAWKGKSGLLPKGESSSYYHVDLQFSKKCYPFLARRGPPWRLNTGQSSPKQDSWPYKCFLKDDTSIKGILRQIEFDDCITNKKLIVIVQ